MSVLSGRFEDFEVLIAAERGEGVYPTTVIESPGGEADGEFALPIAGEELEAALERMRALDTDEALLTDFGTRLFSVLFKGDVLSRYAESVGIAREGKGLRIRLRIVPPELAALPWELLYDPEKREFLGLSKRALITRYLQVPRPPSPLKTELPLRLLIAIASPADLPPLDSEGEVARIETALAKPVEQNLIQFDILRSATARALRDKLLEPYHVLHFIGHGDFDEGVGSLAFEDRDGGIDLVSGRTLSAVLKNTSVQLVVLNACQSARNTQNVRAFTGVGPALVEAGIPAVVAMQFVVEDDSAAAFAQDFYGMLSRYLPVDECVSRAREGLMLEAGLESVDWATPLLFLRAPDGVLFVPKEVERVEDDVLEKVGGIYLGDLSTAHREPVEAAAKLPHEKEIINYLWAIADFPAYRRWAEPHEAMSRWVARYEDGYWDDLTRQEVSAVADREPVTVILGDTGMGKTVILERLAFLYAERALRSDADDLVPVFIKLSQYGGEDSLVPLIRIGLNRFGGINLSSEEDDAQTRTLLGERQFVFLINGLNQMPGDETQRAYGVDVVSRFLEEYPQHKYVLTCRTSAYDDQFHEYGEWIILPHSSEDVRAYFLRQLGEARGSQLYQSLPDRMREMARVPLLLSMLLDEFRDRGEGAAKQRGLLFAHFASRMLSEEEASISVENQTRFLARLAFAMKLDQTSEYSQVSALKAIGEEAGKAELWEFAPQGVLDDLIASGLLRTGSTARIAFSHPWFQDYFAALVLQEQFERGDVDWETLAREYWWREAILFLASMVREPAALIQGVLAYDPLLAAECLLEAEAVGDALRGLVVAAVAEREQVGSEKEKERATELLTELQAAGMVPDVASHRQAVDARVDETLDLRTDESEEKTTSVSLLVKGHLVVAKGPLAGLSFPLLDGTTVCLGRSRQANITLRDKSVSRRHAEIKVAGEEFTIRDLGSTNGTKVNGQQITDWRGLQDGDEIQLGHLPLNLEVQKH